MAKAASKGGTWAYIKVAFLGGLFLSLVVSGIGFLISTPYAYQLAESQRLEEQVEGVLRSRIGPTTFKDAIYHKSESGMARLLRKETFGRSPLRSSDVTSRYSSSQYYSFPSDVFRKHLENTLASRDRGIVIGEYLANPSLLNPTPDEDDLSLSTLRFSQSLVYEPDLVYSLHLVRMEINAPIYDLIDASTTRDSAGRIAISPEGKRTLLTSEATLHIFKDFGPLNAYGSFIDWGEQLQLLLMWFAIGAFLSLPLLWCILHFKGPSNPREQGQDPGPP